MNSPLEAGRQRCPELAHDAIDVLIVAGFADLETACDAVLARLSAPDAADGLTIGDWIEVIRVRAATDLESLKAASPTWREFPATVYVFTHERGVVIEKRRNGPVDRSYYAASYHALQVLKSENAWLKRDLTRVWRQLLRTVDEHAAWQGRSRLSAFDWYVMIVRELEAQRCRNRRAARVVAGGGAS